MSKFFPAPVVLMAVFISVIFAFADVSSAEVEDGQVYSNSQETHSTRQNHIVRKGDTLSEIALEYQIPLENLIRANGLKTSLIRPGQVLEIPKNSGSELNRGNISRDDMALLARLIHAEARGESFEGQVAVGAVILNRLGSPHFPKTITEVVFQKSNRVYQFSPVGDGSIDLEPDERAIRAAKEALSGRDPTGGALFFYNPVISEDQWIRTLPVLTKIGNHVFATCS